MDDIQPRGCDDRATVGNGKMGEGRVDGRICQEKLIHITVNDAVVPFEKTGAECIDGTRTSFVILR